MATRKGDGVTAQKTVFQVFVEKSGRRKATRAVEWLVAWGEVYEGLGRAPTAEEFVQLSGRDKTTLWRYSSALRVAGGFGVPAEKIWTSLPKVVRAGVGRSPEDRWSDVAFSPWRLGDG